MINEKHTVLAIILVMYLDHYRRKLPVSFSAFLHRSLVPRSLIYTSYLYIVHGVQRVNNTIGILNNISNKKQLEPSIVGHV